MDWYEVIGITLNFIGYVFGIIVVGLACLGAYAFIIGF